MGIIPLESGVQWCRWTFNPWVGCHYMSEGCLYCYAEREYQGHWKKDFSIVQRTGKNIWKKPELCSKQLEAEFPGLLPNQIPVDARLMFTASFSDIFIAEADTWRADFWQLVRSNPKIIFLVLTKRIARARKLLPPDWGEGYENVWLGTSVENQDQANRRLPILCGIPARRKFVSFEPLIGSVDLEVSNLSALAWDWSIIGGESGNETGNYLYRPCEMDWISNIAFQSKKRGAKIFIKQMGTHIGKSNFYKDRHGGDLNEFPPYLQIRQIPEA